VISGVKDAGYNAQKTPIYNFDRVINAYFIVFKCYLFQLFSMNNTLPDLGVSSYI
jgi:hypothetical protein